MNNERYARQISLNEIGTAGQEKLAEACVAIVGCGGLGAIAAAYLAGAGIGELVLIDGDRPQASNLHRQVFYSAEEEDFKVAVLTAKLKQLNPECTVRPVNDYLSKANIARVLDSTTIDLVLECTDQAQVKHLVSDYCAIHEIPLVYGAVHKSQGYLALFANQKETDCHLRDLFPAPDERLPTCAEVGVLGTAAGLIGLLQANEALKWLLGIGQSLRNRLLTYDCLGMQQHIVQLGKTFQEDLETVFESSNYGSEANTPDFSITTAVLKSWPADSYQLFSLMNEAQEPELRAGATRYHKGALNAGPGKKVFYCARGRQSRALASLLRKQGLEAYALVL